MSLRSTIILAASALLLCGLGTIRAGAADDPETEFLRAYMQAQRAEKLEAEGRLGEALSRYKGAEQILRRLTTDYPDWQTLIVEYRSKKTRSSISRLETQLQSAAPTDGELTLPSQQGSPADSSNSLPGGYPPPQEDFGAGSASSVGGGDTEILRLQQRIAALQGQLKASEASRKDLSAKLEAAVKQEGVLRQELADAGKGDRERIVELEGKLAQSRQEMEAVLQAISVLPGEEGSDPAARVAALAAKYEESQKQNKDLNDRISLMMSASGGKEIGALTAEIARLNEDAIRLQLQSDSQKATIADLQARLDKSSAELAEVRLSGITPAEVQRLTGENQLLKDILRTQLKAQARRDQARKLVTDELSKLQVSSEEVTKQLDLLAAPVLDLSDTQRQQLSALLREPVLEQGTADLTATIATTTENPGAPAPATGPAGPARQPTGPEEASSSSTPAAITPAVPPLPEELVQLAKQGREAFQNKNFDEAEQAYDTLLAKSPNNSLALSNLAAVYFHTDRLKAAEMMLKKAVTVSPDDAYSHQTLGIVFFRQGRYEEAVTSLTRSVDLNPKNPVARNYLGITASKKGWAEAAERELLEAISLNPSYAEAHFNLAVVYAMSEPPMLNLAKKHYQESVNLGGLPDRAMERLLK